MRAFSVTRGSATLRGSEVGSGVPVVFLHAGVADRRSWFDVMERLAGGGVRSIAYDQRGYGDTTCGDEAHTPRDDLLTVLDGQGVDRAVLVGSSRGGQIALDAAIALPERVAALALVGSASGDAPFGPDVPEVAEVEAAIEAAEASGDFAAVNELEARLWLDGPLAEANRVSGPLRELFLDMNGRAMAAAPAGTQAPFAPAWERLPSLELPAAVLVGDLDLPGLITAAEAVAARLPNATFKLLHGTAHLPMLEQPDAIAAEVAALIRRL